ncbi:hypothetical protein NGM37_34750, partial [Streptomyces sp. TRM76130]|nr:hypothetical protein [Streptomyces sp. TRM76130]
SVDIDGALMKCQEATGLNPVSERETSDWFCAWADHSTIAMVSPGSAESDMSKAEAVDLTKRLRAEVRVAS